MRGRILVTEYPSRPSTPWKVDVPASVAGKRVRRFFTHRATAEMWASEHEKRVKEQGYGAFAAPVTGRSLEDVVATYRERRGREKARQDRTEGQCLDALAREFGAVVMDAVSAVDLEKWIWSRGFSETTRAKYFRYVRALWRWALKKRLIAENIVDQVDAPSAEKAAFILSPDQMRALLALPSPDWLRRAFVVGAFAGLRTEELLGIRWMHVDFVEKQIHVSRDVAKSTGGVRERYVDFTEPLTVEARMNWGKLERDPGALVVEAPYGTFRKARDAAAKAIGLPAWPRNCLRHSFASYHLAECGNASMTALQMGHTSPSMVLKTYAQAVSAKATREWWALLDPPTRRTSRHSSLHRKDRATDAQARPRRQCRD